MAWSFSSNQSHGGGGHRFLCVSVLLMNLASCYGLNSFSFDIHHRFSDPVKGILGINELPDKGTREYYVAMARSDRVFRGRRLAGNHQTPLTFTPSNETYRIGPFGL